MGHFFGYILQLIRGLFGTTGWNVLNRALLLHPKIAPMKNTNSGSGDNVEGTSRTNGVVVTEKTFLIRSLLRSYTENMSCNMQLLEKLLTNTTNDSSTKNYRVN